MVRLSTYHIAGYFCVLKIMVNRYLVSFYFCISANLSQDLYCRRNVGKKLSFNHGRRKNRNDAG